MRCQDVIRQIDSGTPPSLEVIAHLKLCTGCARAAQTSHHLRRLFETASKVADPPSFETVRNRLTELENHVTAWENIMSSIKYQWRSRPLVWAACAVMLTVISFVGLVPFSYTQTVGYEVSVAGLGERLGTSPSLWNVAMSAAGLDDIKVSSLTNNGVESYVFAPINTESEARQLAGALAGLAEVESEPSVEPIRQKVSGSLLAQVVKPSADDEEPPNRIRVRDNRLIINGEQLDGAVFSADSSDAAVESMLEKIWHLVETEAMALSVNVETVGEPSYRVVNLELGPRYSDSAKAVRVYIDSEDQQTLWNKDTLLDRIGKLIEIQFPGRDDTLMAGKVILKVKLDD
ncbi:MAG: hypothetical protein OEV49_07115 [candidate division Zixibacteria bacterium]|nr:hypothetical protein [candidate division Zixibacteria bacterium]MDH3938019.1 hypothetical protein [candidate division Zixibacteria bacterium]MDH4034902.1 hypothetical protein [candidate division Zixibacteria bacterium]